MGRGLFIILALLLGAFGLWGCGGSAVSSGPEASGTRGAGVTGGGSATTGLRLGTYRALIIGVEQYDSPHWKALPGAKRDAQAIHRMLVERYGFKAEDTRLLLDATSEQAEDALVALQESVKADDLVLIYFAGHGSFRGKDPRKAKKSCWVFKDSATKPGRCSGGMTNDTVQGFIEEMALAKHVLLMSDSCFSGRFATRSATIDASGADISTRYHNPLSLQSREVLASGDPNREVKDQVASGHSPFADVILRQLRNNPKGYVSTTDLTRAVEATYAQNKVGYRPIPGQLRDHDGGEFVFVAAAEQAKLRAAQPQQVNPLKQAQTEAARQKSLAQDALIQAKIQTLLANARLKDSETQPQQALAYIRAGALVEGEAGVVAAGRPGGQRGRP